MGTCKSLCFFLLLSLALLFSFATDDFRLPLSCNLRIAGAASLSLPVLQSTHDTPLDAHSGLLDRIKPKKQKQLTSVSANRGSALSSPSSSTAARATPVVAGRRIVLVAAAAAAETSTGERLRLGNLSPAPGSRRPNKRKGRGHASGQVRKRKRGNWPSVGRERFSVDDDG